MARYNPELMQLDDGATGAPRVFGPRTDTTKITQEELDGFNLEVLLGKCCMVSITHSTYDGKEYANIAGISQVPAALKKLGEPVGVNELMIFTLDPFDQDKFNKLSEGLQGVIKKSAEYRNTFEPNAPQVSSAPSELIDDDIPF